MLALLITIVTFLTFFLWILKRWIAFSVAFLLLISLTMHLIINQHPNLLSHPLENEGLSENFHTHMLQALENLKMEISSEKENLRRIMGQVQEVFNSMDIQKQKIQNVIEEARERFKTDDPINPTPISELTPSQSISNGQMGAELPATALKTDGMKKNQ